MRWAADLSALAVVLGALRNRPLLQASRRDPPATAGTAVQDTTTGRVGRPRHRLRGPLRGPQGLTARSCAAKGGRAASPGRDRARAGRHAVPSAAGLPPQSRRAAASGVREAGAEAGDKLALAAPGSGEQTGRRTDR